MVAPSAMTVLLTSPVIVIRTLPDDFGVIDPAKPIMTAVALAVPVGLAGCDVLRARAVAGNWALSPRRPSPLHTARLPTVTPGSCATATCPPGIAISELQIVFWYPRLAG